MHGITCRGLSVLHHVLEVSLLSYALPVEVRAAKYCEQYYAFVTRHYTGRATR